MEQYRHQAHLLSGQACGRRPGPESSPVANPSLDPLRVFPPDVPGLGREGLDKVYSVYPRWLPGGIVLFFLILQHLSLKVTSEVIGRVDMW